MTESNAASDAPETVSVSTREVQCEGNGPALGHPRVYLHINKEGYVECPYCDRRFEYQER